MEAQRVRPGWTYGAGSDRPRAELHRCLRVLLPGGLISLSGQRFRFVEEHVRLGELHESNADNAAEGRAPSREMQAEIDRLRALLSEREQVNNLLREQNQNLMKLLEDKSPKRSSMGTLAEALADRIRGSK